MGRKQRRPEAGREEGLRPCFQQCLSCGRWLWVAYYRERTVTTLTGLVRLRLQVRRCVNQACPRYRVAYRPEDECRWALPHSEIGFDVIAAIGAWRFGEHRSVPEIHQALRQRGVPIAERTVTHLIQRYEELVALRLSDQPRLRARLERQGAVILALDGMQPEVGHEVLWVIRDCLSGEVLLARSLLGGTETELAGLLEEVRAALTVPVRGLVSDGQPSIRKAVAGVFPGVPHQLCQFHYLHDAAGPIYEADRHAKKLLKKEVRGVRPIERALEGRTDEAAAALRGYCLAVRGALTDDGRPPLAAAGLQLHERLTAIGASLDRVAEKGAAPPSWRACGDS
jgi:hypothetical protein